MDNARRSNPHLLLPECMRITERPMPISPQGVAKLVASLNSEPPAAEPDLGMLREIALQVWRLEKRLERVEVGTPLKSKRPFEDSTGRLRGLLDGAGVTTEDPLGSPYTDGLIELEVLAFEEPDGPPPNGCPEQWVKQTIRPIIRHKATLLSRGEVIVAVAVPSKD